MKGYSLLRGLVKPPPSLVNIYKELEADIDLPRAQVGNEHQCLRRRCRSAR